MTSFGTLGRRNFIACCLVAALPLTIFDGRLYNLPSLPQIIELHYAMPITMVPSLFGTYVPVLSTLKRSNRFTLAASAGVVIAFAVSAIVAGRGLNGILLMWFAFWPALVFGASVVGLSFLKRSSLFTLAVSAGTTLAFSIWGFKDFGNVYY